MIRRPAVTEGSMKPKTPPPRKRGRPETRIIKLDAAPEQASRALFSTVKPPAPSIRVKPKDKGLARAVYDQL